MGIRNGRHGSKERKKWVERDEGEKLARITTTKQRIKRGWMVELACENKIRSIMV